MADHLLTSEIKVLLAKFFSGGAGPTHADIERCFAACDLGDKDPGKHHASKQDRVLKLCDAASKRPATVAAKALEELLAILRVHGTFDSEDPQIEQDVTALRRALAKRGVVLDSEGCLQEHALDFDTGGRAALEEQLDRLRRSMEDPSALIGQAKDLLEAICKFVLEEQSVPFGRNMKFDQLLNEAFGQLQLQPGDVDSSQPGGKQLRAIYQSAKTTASTINELRNLHGTGHGRTLPTSISEETARYVVRQAVHVGELLLSTHDRQLNQNI